VATVNYVWRCQEISLCSFPSNEGRERDVLRLMSHHVAKAFGGTLCEL
jgi:hypothetical protein